MMCFFHKQRKSYDNRKDHSVIDFLATLLIICYLALWKEDGKTVRLPYLLVEAIDKFVETDLARKNGIFSRSDFITRVLVQWFSHYEKDFDMFVGREVKRNLKGDDITKPFD